MTIEKSIGWTDMTLNPIKGKCKGGCWYCYYSGKRGMLNRFKQNPEISLKLNVFDNLPLKPKKIFLCSTHDLFGSWVSKKWRDDIFANIQLNPQHTFQILTKFPQNIDRPMPDNVWLGVSVTKDKDWWRAKILAMQSVRVKFLSLEPLFERVFLENVTTINWMIIGKLTGHGKKYDPERDWLEQYVKNCKFWNIPIFLKNNLKSIWGENLIQQFPDGE